MRSKASSWSSMWHARLTRSPSGYEDLTQPHVDALWRVAYRMTSDRDAADDLTQETCLRAYRAFESFQQGTNYKAWIFRIMTNLCSDHLRRRARAPFQAVDPDGTLPDMPAPVHEAPENRLMQKDFRQDLSNAIAALSPELRLVMSLSLLNEMSYDEIAEIAGCPVGTVRSRLSRGRQHLRDALVAHAPERAVSLSVVSEATPGTDRSSGGAS